MKKERICTSRINKLYWILPVLSFMILHACITAPAVKKGDQYLGQHDYIKAIVSYEQALSETKSEKKKEEISKKIETTKSNLATLHIGRAEDQFNGLQTPKVPDLDGIIKMLRGVATWDDANRSIAAEINRYEAIKNNIKTRADEMRKSALDHSESYRYESAIKIINQALEINPNSRKLGETLLQVQKKRESFDRVGMFLGEENLEQALSEFRGLSGAMASKPLLEESPFKEQFLSLIRIEASDLVQENKWQRAIDYLKKWDIDDLSEDLSEVKVNAGTHYSQLARDAVEKRENYHKAFIYTLKASELGRNDMEIFNLKKIASDQVDKSIQKHIAVTSFDSPSNDPDAGKQFSDSLISYLYSVLPYGINILERDKINLMLNEHRRVDDYPEELLNVDLTITGTVSLFKVDTSIDTRTATVKVKLAEQIVENPEFSQMIKLYGSDQSLWPDIPERTIKKDTIQLLNYTKGVSRKNGFAKISIRIFDAKKGTITFIKDYDASIFKSSEFQDEVAAAGIKYIPLNLPTDTEIKGEMRKAIVAEIVKVVKASFEKREVRFLNQAKFFLARMEKEAAFIPLAKGYLYCIRNNIDANNSEFLEIKEMINTIIQ